MFGHPPPFRPCGGVHGVAQPLGMQPIHPNSNIFPNPNFYYFLPQQNPNFLPQPNPYLQNPIGFPQIQQQIPNLSFQTKPENLSFQAPPPPPPFTSVSNNIDIPKQHVSVKRKSIQEVDKAAMEAWRELLESNENVTAWKVSAAALLKVKADSWKSLGYELNHVPSLTRLLAVEQKIHAFIQCFVTVRRITSLYDLEVSICESEDVEQFEDLELGPLLRHPLVLQSFSVNSDLTEIYRITTEEIISYLCEFIDSHKKEEFKADVFLDFVSKKKFVNGREKLCVRVMQEGEYINHIKQARQSEDKVLDKCYEKMRTPSVEKSDKCPLLSAKKQELDDQNTAVSKPVKSFSSKNTQFCGKHTRFASSSSDDDIEENKYEYNHNKKKTENNCSVSLPTVTSDRVTSCPYPSVTEEMTRLGLKSELGSGSCTPAGSIKSIADNELSQRKRRCKNKSSSTSLRQKLHKRDKFVEDLEDKGSDQATGSHSISTTTWKESRHMNEEEEIVDREPFFCGSADSSFVYSLVNWVLPYAQRYIYKKHPDKYFQLKQSDFEKIRHLKIVVVEKLFYRDVTKKREVTSRKRHECNCLLQDNILYCSQESDTRAVILELSCFLLSQESDSYFAKFLHMITAMVESGVSEEQTEFFILNSQKVPKLPADECVWSLQPVSSSNKDTTMKNGLSVNPEEQSSSVIKRRPGINSSWPPVEWETELDFENVEEYDIPPTEFGSEMDIEVDPTLITQEAVLFEPVISESSSNLAAAPIDSADLDLPDLNMFLLSNRTGQISAQQQQAMLTGRLGELVAFRYFVGKIGGMFVKWVNETNETGLPYDIVLGGEDENSREYVEVKATKHERKNWFQISMREWQFAIERGESFSIAQVVLTDNNNMAKVTVYKNPARLCQLGNLRLAIVVPNLVE